MINPTKADVGRRVIYNAGYPGAQPELGRITSVTDLYVFVRPDGGGNTSQATARSQLEWLPDGVEVIATTDSVLARTAMEALAADTTVKIGRITGKPTSVVWRGRACTILVDTRPQGGRDGE